MKLTTIDTKGVQKQNQTTTDAKQINNNRNKNNSNIYKRIQTTTGAKTNQTTTGTKNKQQIDTTIKLTTTHTQESTKVKSNNNKHQQK